MSEVPAQEVAAAVERARAAQPAWAALPMAQRVRHLRRVQAAVFDSRAEIVRTIVNETRSVVPEAEFQVLFSLSVFAYWCRMAPPLLRPRPARFPLYLGPKRARVHRRPLGVVANLGTWNFPWSWPMIDAVPALLAGNTVIFKPSEWAPKTGLLFGRLCRQAGLPDAVYQVLAGGPETGAALVEQCDMVTFTGSRRVGQKILQAAARRMIPVVLEMGGKDPMIVLADADLDVAARAAVFGGMFFGGQVCISVERVYVEAAVWDAFLERLLHHVSRLRLGSGAGFDVGPMINEIQLAKVEAQVQDAVAKGARLLCGGRRLPELGGLFYAPTVLTDVTPDMQVMQEETFGPVLALQKVRNAEEAVARANEGTYGLASSIYTRNRRLAREMAMRIEAGSTTINDLLIHFHMIDLPFGGHKGSSYGYRGGPESLFQFVRPQSVMEDRLRYSDIFFRFPLDRFKSMLAEALMRLWYAPGWRRFLG